MIQVTVTASGGGPTHRFGPYVETLEQAAILVETLEWLYAQREEAYKEHEELPDVEWLPALADFEGCDVYATDEIGNMWTYVDHWEVFHVVGGAL